MLYYFVLPLFYKTNTNTGTMKKMTHLDIVQRLIGKIRPIGETNEDEKRFENLKAMCELTEILISEIDEVGYDFKNRVEYSMKEASEYASNFLITNLGIV